MEIEQLKKTVDEFGRAVEEFKKSNDQRLKALESKGSVDPLVSEKVDRINKSIDDVLARVEKMEALKNAPTTDTEDKVALAKSQAEAKAALNAYLKRGDLPSQEVQQKLLSMYPEQERKALATQYDSTGGFLVRPEVSTQITEKVFESSPIMELAEVLTIGSDTFQEAYVDDESGDGGWVGEVEARSESGTPAFSQLEIPLHEVYAEPRASQRMLDDAAIDIEAWLQRKVAEKLGRKAATAFVTGNGIKKPMGIMGYASGTTFGKLEQVTCGAANLVTADGLISLQGALFEAFQQNATWLMQRATRNNVRKLKTTGSGEYVWNWGVGLNGAPSEMLLGKPVRLAADIAAEGASALPVAYGDFRIGYLVVMKPGIRVLRDPFTAKPQVKFYSTMRIGGGVRNFQAIKIGVL
jgi:HK97 family phage major capsid protein